MYTLYASVCVCVCVCMCIYIYIYIMISVLLVLWDKYCGILCPRTPGIYVMGYDRNWDFWGGIWTIPRDIDCRDTGLGYAGGIQWEGF